MKVDPTLVDKLIDRVKRVKAALITGNSQEVLLEAGKAVEVGTRVLQSLIKGRHTPLNTSLKISKELNRLENHPNLLQKLKAVINCFKFISLLRNFKAAHATEESEVQELDVKAVSAALEWAVTRLLEEAAPGKLKELRNIELPHPSIPAANATVQEKILLYLLSIYPEGSKAPEIAEKAEVSRSHTYKTLKSLKRRKLVKPTKEKLFALTESGYLRAQEIKCKLLEASTSPAQPNSMASPKG